MSALTTTLPTVGGALVDITGRNLGLTPSTLSLSYSGGSTGLALRTHAVPAGACTIVAPGTVVRCPTMPGVGANFSFVATVDGGSSDPSADLLSYSPPIITDVEGPGAVRGPAAGASLVYLRGVRAGAGLGYTTQSLGGVGCCDVDRVVC